MGVTIAIDGFAGSGKSTLAKQLAQSLKYTYLDTGALYRAITLRVVEKFGEDFIEKGCNEKALHRLLKSTHISIEQGSDGNKVFLNSVDVTQKIREPHISNQVSKISAQPVVRKFLLRIQRDNARRQDCVLDGRDIGTAVLPNATYKFFITAHIDTRAKRRWQELKEKNIPISLAEVKKNIQERDEYDTSRSANPLRQAKNAIPLDTTMLTPEIQLQVIQDVIKRIEWEKKNPIFNIYKGLLRLFLNIFCRIEFYYEDYNAIQTFSGLIVANHISNIDPPAAGMGIPFQVNFLAKASLESPMLKPCNLILIDRDRPTPGTIKDVLAAMEKGQSVVLFPEGTRSLDGSIGSGKNGAGLLAHKTHKQILPVYIYGTNNALPKNAKFPHFTKVRIAYGKPYTSQIQEQKGVKARDFYQQISNEMLDKIRDVQYKLENNLLTKK